MLDAWAATLGVHLHPGTANACSLRSLQFPATHTSLEAFAHLTFEQRRSQWGFSPRLYAVRIDAGLLSIVGWVFRWSADDAKFGFVGDTHGCRADRHLEIVSSVGFRRNLGISDGDEFRIEFAEAAA
jgi:hypothetical protein